VAPGETTLTQVATGLKGVIPTATTPTNGRTLKLQDDHGFTLGGLKQLIQTAGK